MDDELVALVTKAVGACDREGHKGVWPHDLHLPSYCPHIVGAIRAALAEARRDERRKVLRELLAWKTGAGSKVAERARRMLAEDAAGEEG
ncbi:MAG: hypothetical protein NUW01_00120 [Gemmatimonadaceae bacterium]|nr:hypothetical protein [Gemmatimonadaceae bacterium]